jgi:hypothetical protein
VILSLTEDSVASHLRERGVLPPDKPARVEILPGGVSSATFLVTTGQERWVVKQPLPYLAVADVWPARQTIFPACSTITPSAT